MQATSLDRSWTVNVVRAIRTVTQGTYRLSYLSGPRWADVRAAILTAIQRKRVSKARAGINALRIACYEMAGIGEGCPAAQESDFVEWCKEQERSGVANV